MTEFLLFRLEAPLMSFGEIAVGEIRGSWDRPSKSAVLGLCGAALGLDRADPVWDYMDGGYGFAVRTDRPGRRLIDYHTVQSAPGKPGSFRTRAELLASPKVGAIITRRDYLCDAAFTVTLTDREEPPFELERLAEALRNPTFQLYAGRKSCPLALPPTPMIISAATLAAALARHDELVDYPAMVQARRRREDDRKPIATDADIRGELLAGLELHREERRRDRIAARSRWQFGLRNERIMAIPKEAS